MVHDYMNTKLNLVYLTSALLLLELICYVLNRTGFVCVSTLANSHHNPDELGF